MSLEKRIAALEQRTFADPVTLHFADGSERVISGGVRHCFRLLDAESNGERSELADAIRNAISVDEPDHIVELLQAILQGPNESDGEERHEKPSDTVDDGRWPYTHHLRLASERNQVG